MHAQADPIVITGIGVLACNGIGREAFWDAICEGRSGIGPVRNCDVSDLPCQIGGELHDFNPEDFMRKAVVKNWHRHVHQALAASRLALQDADLEKQNPYAAERMATAIGTSVGSPDEAYDAHTVAYRSQGYASISKYASSATSGHAATVHVSIDTGARGPAVTISSGCSTGLDVLAWGCTQLKLGRADMALVGATESPIFKMAMAGACSLGILSRRNDAPAEAMRPFSGDSDGIVLSEAAVVLVLERLSAARARGARILAEVAGNGSAAESHNPMLLERSGEALARACRMAMDEAGAGVNDVDCIQAHGVSIKLYDRAETNAYKNVFGDRAYRVPVTAVKSMVGQPYSAGGLVGVAAGVCTLNRGILTPTLNLTVSDPECDLDYVPLKARRSSARTMLVSSMCFGGTHTASVIRSLN